jgi:hypothetical protein
MTILRKVNLDVVANLAILITCAVVGGTVLQRYYGPGRHVTSPRTIKAGDRAESLPGFSYTDASATLVLHVKSTCAYCTESMDFYRRVRDAMAGHRTLKFVVVGVEPKGTLQHYLDQHELRPDTVISAPDRRHPTPTLMLVDTQGIVRDAWLGLQTHDGEQRLFDQVATLRMTAESQTRR